ncbi:sensor histidine kinase [Hydrogenophaga sp.]|uniref:sensor histidine kinase n=1 Tax=Hydrogenophaga sp. TaxID=1904254 RepID=UPI002721E0E0|nr:sensor histidine kinase [Hydrogenophaga sp.]MDO9434837.1 sensor histidine kinase N-terminal domain-containing protein [Hydrogenophaga sp.]
MKRPNWPLVSLRRLLLLLLIPGMLVVTAAEFWLSWATVNDAADAAYDRSLLGAVKSIDSSISTASGGLGVELPYRMLEFFELTAQGQVFYRVASEDGLVEIGSAGLPLPPLPLETGRPQFYDGVYFGQDVRVGSYARVLTEPLAGQLPPQRVVVQVAETMEARDDFRQNLLLRTLFRDLALIVLATGLLILSIHWAMTPLSRFRKEVEARDAEDLAPMSAEGVPAEVLPVVSAINQHIARAQEQAELRRQFVDDASHQLRTPLATLSTQVAYALREQNPAEQHKVLESIRAQLDQTIVQTNQLLSLARADSAPLDFRTFDLTWLAESVVSRWWVAARDQSIDLGLDAPGTKLDFKGDADLLRQALSNLVHNAIRHGGPGCHVTLSVRAYANAAGKEFVSLCVVDNGRGLASADLERLGERFFRGGDVSVPGSGLGLAFVRTVVQRHGGHTRFLNGTEGRGLRVELDLPRGRCGASASG